jgi:hypothetical protein
LYPNSNAIGEALSEICGHKGTPAQTDSTFLYIWIVWGDQKSNGLDVTEHMTARWVLAVIDVP